MRRTAIMLACIAATLAVAPTGAGASTRLEGTFSVLFPKGHQPPGGCGVDEFCGTGTLAGFGAATITILDETSEPIEGTACYAVTRVERIDLTSGEGSLVIESSGTFCPPGESGESDAGPSSYGHPGVFDLRFVVNGAESTGVFAGASGSGSERFTSAGGVGTWALLGTIETA
jgi:hypothetical protein